jgi:hypothetical protein
VKANTMKEHREDTHKKKDEANEDGFLYDDDDDDEEQGGLKSCSTTTSTTSDTSDGSSLPSLSNDSDSASKEDEEQMFTSASRSTPSDLLRHRRDSTVPPPFTPPSLLQYASPSSSPLEDNSDDDSSRCTKVKDRNSSYCYSIHRLARMMKLVLILGLSFAFACRFWSHGGSILMNTNPQLKWRIQVSQRSIRKTVRRIQQQPMQQPSVTILLKASHIDLLQTSLDQHAYCPIVDSVRIEWQGDAGEELPESIWQHASGKVRELEDSGAWTTSVMLLKEGIQFDCHELKRAYHEWQRDPVRVVGLLSSTDGQVSLVSDAALLIHKSLLVARPRLVATEEPCREFVLSAFLATATGRPSVPMVSKPKRLLSTQKVNKEQETQCVSFLAKAFGLTPAPWQLTVNHQYIGQ